VFKIVVSTSLVDDFGTPPFFSRASPCYWFRLVDRFELFAHEMGAKHLLHKKGRYLRVYWDAYNVSLPKSDDMDHVFLALRDLYEKLEYSNPCMDYELMVVCNQSTYKGITPSQMKKLNNHGIPVRVEADIREVGVGLSSF